MFKNKGFSLIEMIVVMGMMLVVFYFSVPYGINFYRSQMLEAARGNIINALEQARHNAILQKNDSNFGVTLSQVANSYVVFQGTAYGTRAVDQDEIFPLSADIAYTGLTDVIFYKLTGLPSATGTISLTYGTVSKTILIGDSGGISEED